MYYQNLNLSKKHFYNKSLFKALLLLFYGLSFIFIFLTLKTFYKGFKLTEESKARVLSLENNLKKIKEENEILKNKIEKIDKAKLTEIAEEINYLISEKTFSWSKLLEELENTLPDEVRLTALSTKKEKKGEIVIRIIALSPKREGMVETLEALKSNKNFKDVKPIKFMDEEKSQAIGKNFEIEFSYLKEEEDAGSS